MSQFETFERLIVRKEAGYVCDEGAMVKLTNLASFDTAVFKLTTKIETCLLLMSSHTPVDMFTIDVVPLRSREGGNQGKSLSRDEALYNSWDKLEARGCHGLLTLAHVDATSMPNNGSRVKYSLAQFVDSLLHGVEAYFMFQKFSPLFTLNAAGLWDAVENTKMETCFLVLAWKLTEEPGPASLVQRLPLTQRNSVAVTHNQDYTKPRSPILTPVPTPVIESRKRDPPTPEESQAPPAKRRGRPAKQSKVIKPVVRQESSEEEQEEEEDEEVTFKVQPPPIKIPEVVYGPGMTPPKPPTPTVTPPAPVVHAPEESIGDVTFGFDSSGPKTPGRKSTGGRKSMGGRKSLLPAWPEDEKDSVLTFFDHINPKQTEQARIALACKYGTMKYDRELPSKLLYQWVQRKGRVPDTPAPGTSYDLPESERTMTAVTLFRSLNPEHSEASRISFTCRFFQTQYEMELKSKQLYDMLQGKKAKATGRGRR